MPVRPTIGHVVGHCQVAAPQGIVFAQVHALIPLGWVLKWDMNTQDAPPLSERLLCAVVYPYNNTIYWVSFGAEGYPGVR